MKRKGFTLVELLIVIAIIGALAAMMTLSSGTSVAKAKASGIISGFKVVRTAVIMYEVDDADSPTLSEFNTKSSDYVGPESLNQLHKYTVTFVSEDTSSKDWKATYTAETLGSELESQVKTIGASSGVTSSGGSATMQVR